MTFKHRNHSWSFVVIRGHSWSLVVIRGHSWSFVVTRGHSWSLVCTFRQDLPLCLLANTMYLAKTKWHAIRRPVYSIPVFTALCVWKLKHTRILVRSKLFSYSKKMLLINILSTEFIWEFYSHKSWTTSDHLLNPACNQLQNVCTPALNWEYDLSIL
jgi:hypothetical protein